MNITVMIIWGAFIALFAVWMTVLVIRVVKQESTSILKRNPVVAYDERQLAMQGVAYKYGFLTTMGFFLLWTVTAALEVTLFTPLAGAMIGLLVGCIVVFTISILTDAFFYVGEKAPLRIAALNVIFLSWLPLTSKSWGQMVDSSGALTDEVFYLLLCLLYVAMDILFLVRYVQKRKKRAA